MPLYVTQYSLTTEAWAALAKNPEDRSIPVKALFEKIGGRLSVAEAMQAMKKAGTISYAGPGR
jgi:hypothetical protein